MKSIYNTMVIIIASLLVMVMPAAAYTIDGCIDDWNINPQNDSSHRLIDDSFVPDPVGTIDYVIENDNADWALGAVQGNMDNFTGLEWCDIEAMYVDDNSTHIFVLIITSMPKLGKNWGSDHIQPGDLALDFDDGSGFEYGVKIVENDPEDGGFGEVGAIYLNPEWDVLDPGTDRTDIVSIVDGEKVGQAEIIYTGNGGTEAGVPDGPESNLPWDTFGTTRYSWLNNPPIPNEVIEIAIPKSALTLQQTTGNIQSSITCGNGVIKLESVSLISEFATLAIPVITLLGLVFFMRRKEQR